MKTVKVPHEGSSPREYEVPEDWIEAHAMLWHSLNEYYDKRGGNLERMSVAARVAFSMFPGAPDPTTALLGMMLAICDKEGAGISLDDFDDLDDA
jgi:hypothetical protein